jgi:hypothetical protein
MICAGTKGFGNRYSNVPSMTSRRRLRKSQQQEVKRRTALPWAKIWPVPVKFPPSHASDRSTGVLRHGICTGYGTQGCGKKCLPCTPRISRKGGRTRVGSAASEGVLNVNSNIRSMETSKDKATRVYSQGCLKADTPFPCLRVGGRSADLTPSQLDRLPRCGGLQKDSPEGTLLSFRSSRARHGGRVHECVCARRRPYCATFLVFGTAA